MSGRDIWMHYVVNMNMQIIQGKYMCRLEGWYQRGLNSKRGPHLFHPRPPFDSKRFIIAPKACQMSLKLESFDDESFNLK